MERLITRQQQVMRAFFGLGPGQFSVDDVVSPTIDVEKFMRAANDCEIFTNISVAQGPGLISTAFINWNGRFGTWLVHAVALDTTGPVTSGSVRLWIAAQLNASIWGKAMNVPLADRIDLVPRMGGNIYTMGRVFDTPLTFQSRQSGSDQIFGNLFNDAASVGNAQCTLWVLARALEGVGT